jgi:hypothetical protein
MSEWLRTHRVDAMVAALTAWVYLLGDSLWLGAGPMRQASISIPVTTHDRRGVILTGKFVIAQCSLNPHFPSNEHRSRLHAPFAEFTIMRIKYRSHVYVRNPKPLNRFA